MQPLIIDYVLDGDNRGYNFVTPTDHLAPAVMREIWRHAMPRGQGWGDARYLGVRVLKCIPLSNGRAAFSQTIVTDKRDEMGRAGIRRAEIIITRAKDYQAHVQAYWNNLPQSIRTTAESKFNIWIWKRIVDKVLPKLKGDSQIILAHPYTTPEAWQVVEALVLKLAMARLVKGWGKITSFTTLALDYREESRLVALPLDVVENIKPHKHSPIINIS